MARGQCGAARGRAEPRARTGTAAGRQNHQRFEAGGRHKSPISSALKIPRFWLLLPAQEGAHSKGRGQKGPLTCHTGQVRGDPPCPDFLISTSPHTAFSGAVLPASPCGCPLLPLPTLWGDATLGCPPASLSPLPVCCWKMRLGSPGRPLLMRRKWQWSPGDRAISSHTAACSGRVPQPHHSAESPVPFPAAPLPQTWKAASPLLRVGVSFCWKLLIAASGFNW